MSRSQAAWPWVETQEMNISQQLNLGIRFLDRRPNLDDGNVLRMVHGNYGLDTTYDIRRHFRSTPRFSDRE
jgi:hypothetical protein